MSAQQMGKIENGVPLDYNFSISDVVKESWGRVKGFKATAWGGFAIMAITVIVLSVIIGLIAPDTKDESGNTMFNLPAGILGFIRTLITLPMVVGIYMMAIKRSVDLPVRAKMTLEYYGYFLGIAGVYILSFIIVFIPFFIGGFLFALSSDMSSPVLHMLVALIAFVTFLIGAYLAFCYFPFSTQLVVEKKLGIWPSLEVARKAVTKHWFKLFFLYLLISLIVVVSVFTVIGLIWSIPFAIAMRGVTYRIIFGVEEAR